MKRKMLNQCKAIVLSVALATAAISPVIQPTQNATVTEAAKKTIASKKVTFSSKKRTVYVGDIVALKAVMKPSNSTDKLTWTSSNKKIATVNKYGIITAKAAGITTITVKTSSGKTDKCAITVKKILTETDVKKIVEENTLSEDDVKKIVKEVQTDDDVKKLIKDNTVSESEIINLINKYATGTNTTTYVSSESSSVSNSQIEEIVKETLDKLGLYNNEKFDEDESTGKDVPCDSNVTFPYTWMCSNECEFTTSSEFKSGKEKLIRSHEQIKINNAVMKQYTHNKKATNGYFKYKDIIIIDGYTDNDVIENIEKEFTAWFTISKNENNNGYNLTRYTLEMQQEQTPYQIINKGDGNFILKYCIYSNIDAKTFKPNCWESICCINDKFVSTNNNTDTGNANHGSGNNNSSGNVNVVTVDVVQESNDKLNIIIPNLTANSVKTNEISVVRSDNTVIPVKSAVTYEDYTPGIRITTFANMIDGKDYTVCYKPLNDANEYRGTFTSFNEPKNTDNDNTQVKSNDYLRIDYSDENDLTYTLAGGNSITFRVYTNNVEDVSWSCDNEEILEIEEEKQDKAIIFKVRGRRNGIAIFTFTLGDIKKTYTINITRTYVDIQDIWMDNSGGVYKTGDKITFYIKAIPYEYDITKINITLSNKEEDGKIYIYEYTLEPINLTYIGDNTYKFGYIIKNTDKPGNWGYSVCSFYSGIYSYMTERWNSLDAFHFGEKLHFTIEH